MLREACACDLHRAGTSTGSESPIYCARRRPNAESFSIVELNQRLILTAVSGRSGEGPIHRAHKLFAEPAAPSKPRVARRVPAPAHRPDRHGGRETTTARQQTPQAKGLPSGAIP